MGITRRQFMFSLPAVGAEFLLTDLTLPVITLLDLSDRASDVLTPTGEPQGTLPMGISAELVAADNGTGEYRLSIGDPWQGPPRLTLREYIDRYYGGDVETYVAENCDVDEAVDLDSEVDEWVVMESWAVTDSPNALAYNLLDGLDLGPDPDGTGVAGELWFINGPCPGSDYKGVHAADRYTLGLLQDRLNQLNTGIRIRVL